MDDDRVLDAALEVFLKYGYRRATMADIARGAGVSRPTLYVRFPNKQAAFRGVVVRGTAELMREIEAVLESGQSLPEKLQGVFEIWTVRPFALAARSPAAEELMAAEFDFVNDVFESARERLIRRLARLLRQLKRPRAEAHARVLVAAALGFKQLARNPRHMARLVADLVAVGVQA